MNIIFLIKNPTEACPTTGETLFWSNIDGWVSKDCADQFTKQDTAEMSLPLGGIWDYQMKWDK